MNLSQFHGTGVALVTPMHEDGSLDWAGLERILQHVTDGGVQYLVVQGTTGESATTSPVEKKEILQFIKTHNPGKLPIVYGVGGNNTPEVVKTIQSTDFEGVAAILSVCPYYNKPGKRGVIAHFTAVADACPVPVFMYNIPSRTGINMSSETTIALAHHPNIIGIKEASCIIEQCMEIYRDKPEDFLLISGDDVQAVPIISIGGVGAMSVIANAVPGRFAKMIASALQGDFVTARQELGHFLAIDPLLYEEGNPVGIKKILEIMGLMDAQVRLPLYRASDELGVKMQAILEKDELLTLVHS
ncbi:MAG: 4-hydroxy-tetrahydrodipicolinate synthase [Cytophagaceae bacterium]|nr:4-hydroxy-tetrahydrodipicolinate synthase [Cytophagaceae bacterium]